MVNKMNPLKQAKLLELQIKDITNLTSQNLNFFFVRRKVKKIHQRMQNMFDAYNHYETIIKSLKSNNHELARTLQEEKERSKSYLNDKIMSEYTYHELLKDHVFLKKELMNLEQVIFAYDDELKTSMIPNLVKLSDDITKFKCKNSILRNSIENRRSHEFLPKNSLFPNPNHNSINSNTTQPVYPMVKGYVIQKPTINVRRITMPQENKRILFSNMNVSSPILEESPEENSETNKLSRKCKGGLRQMFNYSNRQNKGSRKPLQSSSVNEVNCFPDSSPENVDLKVRVEPVVRLCDVTRLLQNSSLHFEADEEISVSTDEANRNLKNNRSSPEVLLTKISLPVNKSLTNNADPLEGCSWMFSDLNDLHNNTTKENNAITEKINKSRRSQSIYIENESSECTDGNSVLNTCTVDEIETSDYFKDTNDKQNIARASNLESKKSSYFERNSNLFSNQSTVKSEGKRSFLKSKSYFDNNASNNLATRKSRFEETSNNSIIMNSENNKKVEYDPPTSTSPDPVTINNDNQVVSSNLQNCTERRKRNSSIKNNINLTKPKKSRKKKSDSENVEAVTCSETPQPTAFQTITKDTSRKRTTSENRSCKNTSILKRSNMRCGGSDSESVSSFDSINDSDVQGKRSLRCRKPISYKEPTLSEKLRRNK